MIPHRGAIRPWRERERRERGDRERRVIQLMLESVDGDLLTLRPEDAIGVAESQCLLRLDPKSPHHLVGLLAVEDMSLSLSVLSGEESVIDDRVNHI
jgi:hypothetical protein